MHCYYHSDDEPLLTPAGSSPTRKSTGNVVTTDKGYTYICDHTAELSLFKLNFGIITLLPKKENAVQIQQYHPICLLNVSFKIFTKVVTKRITGIASKVIRPTKTAFMLGRHILEGVVVLHETIHELHRKKMDGVLFKIDFEKAYDKVKWSFLQQTLRMKGFAPERCELIAQFVQGGVGWSKGQ
jgi:hypothetical protein